MELPEFFLQTKTHNYSPKCADFLTDNVCMQLYQLIM